MRRYTILHTIETGGPGGAETVLLELSSRLDPSRFRSVALLPGGRWLPKQLESRKVPTTIARSKNWHDPELLRAMWRLVRNEKVDLIHSHLPGQNFYSCLAGRLTGCPVIATYHGAVELANKKRFRNAFKLWWVRSNAKAFTVVCEDMRKLLEEASFPAQKIFRIYNGIDPNRYVAASSGKLRADLGISADVPLVGMVANIRRAKGYEFFIQAARKVVDDIPEARFVAVGDVDKRLGEDLLGLVQQLGLSERFRFLGFRPDVPEILRDLDVFVLSSTREGFPLVLLEAMASGRPMVVTRCGGPEEIVEDGRTGFMVPSAAPDALAARVCELLLHRELGARFGEAGQAEIEKRFSLTRMIHDYQDLYQKCIGAG